MAVTPASIVALSSVGLLGVATAVAWKTGPYEWWRDSPPKLVRPLAVVFFGFSLAALGLTTGLGNDGNLNVYHGLLASYYVLMVIYLAEIARRAFGWVKPTLWAAAAVQIVASVFLMAAAADPPDNRDAVPVAAVLQLFSALWAVVYDGFIYTARDMPVGDGKSYVRL